MNRPTKLSQNNPLPDKQKFAKIFRNLSNVSYWIHLVLGVISGVTLLLVFFSRSATNNSGIGLGIFIAMFSLMALGFRVYWAYRYRQLAKKLQRVNPDLQPSRTEILQVLRTGLLASSIGLFLAFIASEVSLVSLVAGAIARPQGVAVYEREQVIKIADLLLILAQLNILGAHFLGSANSLGLLSWISKEKV
ncbi:DUF3611 family protein [Waterburya agarophytonicola K14]|uniref:DUF3611 family protein n=1 Tax=Waterburya agarophytonicola KI4 TaxID=2874699 RepID=A0A964BWV4_9CYAN|nr:DUF3611 family protein [Waterburya agarophytonicola]MCC0179737.1 DUF3611 family protein [Waterburya agarophytonicola KI4]